MLTTRDAAGEDFRAQTSPDGSRAHSSAAHSTTAHGPTAHSATAHSPTARRSARRRPRPATLMIALTLLAAVVLAAPALYRHLVGGPAPGATSSPTAAISSTSPSVHVIPSGRLSWGPPLLQQSETVVVGPGHRSLKLNPRKDYTVVLPDHPVDLGGGVSIDGGRNVVMIGGLITVPSRTTVPSDLRRRGLYLKGQTGTIHIEGVRITGDVSDGINLDERNGAVVQIENVLIDRVHGSAAGHHADVLQTWAGPRILAIDGLRATTEYQGFFLLPNQLWKDGPPPDKVIFRRSLVTMESRSGYALWLPERGPKWLDKSGLYVQLPPDKSRRKVSWPNSRLGLHLIEDSTIVTLDQGNPGPLYESPGYAG